MQHISSAIVITLWIILLFVPGSLHARDESFVAKLNNVDAVQAVALANTWRWSDKNITIYVNDQEITFKFPDGQVKKIPMPEDKMLVAVAPYLTKTHT